MSDNVIELKTEAKQLPFSINGEGFTAWQVPGISFMKLVNKMSSGSEAEQAGLMFDVFRSTMTNEEYARFEEFATNPANGVSAEVLFELISKLVEGSAARPTEQSSSSANTQTDGGLGSTEVSSAKES